MDVTKEEQHFTTNCLKSPMSRVYYCDSKCNESEWIFFHMLLTALKKTNKFQAKTKFCCYFCFHKQLLPSYCDVPQNIPPTAEGKMETAAGKNRVYRTSRTNYKLNWQDFA